MPDNGCTPITLTWAPDKTAPALVAASVPLGAILATQRDHLLSYYYTSRESDGMELCQAMRDTLRYLAFRVRNRGVVEAPLPLTDILIPGRCWREIAGGLLIRIGPRGRRDSQFAILTDKIPEPGKTLTLKAS